MGANSQFAEKLNRGMFNRGMFCNKGPASAGPKAAQNERGLQPLSSGFADFCHYFRLFPQGVRAEPLLLSKV
jgi:hypothetical protein